jgi:hypothetical protein
MKDTDRFTCGDCHILAGELSNLTGWPIYCFGERDLLDLHCFVVPRGGWALDVEGLHRLGDFKARWAKTPGYADVPLKLVRCSFAQVVEQWGGEPTFGPGRFSYSRAKAIAPKIAGIALDRFPAAR